MFGVEKSLQSIQAAESEDTPWERLYGKGKKKHLSSQSFSNLLDSGDFQFQRHC